MLTDYNIFHKYCVNKPENAKRIFIHFFVYLCKTYVPLFARYLFFFDIKGVKIETWVVNIYVARLAERYHTLHRMCVMAWLKGSQRVTLKREQITSIFL